MTWAASIRTSTPNIYVKGHAVQQLSSTHTHTQPTALPGLLKWSVTTKLFHFHRHACTRLHANNTTNNNTAWKHTKLVRCSFL